MAEYSYSDLVKMQDQAIHRVREMQERARLTVRENPIEDLNIPNEQDELEKKAEPVENTKEKSTGTTTPPVPQKAEKKNLSSRTNDKDMSVLLPLIMLLNHEGADNILMIALLYILA